MLKYQAIAEDIRQKITQGIYQPDDQLPLTGELDKIYQASKMTIKRALDHLESEGLIVKRRGSGTFVKGLAMNDLDKLIRYSVTTHEPKHFALETVIIDQVLFQ